MRKVLMILLAIFVFSCTTACADTEGIKDLFPPDSSSSSSSSESEIEDGENPESSIEDEENPESSTEDSSEKEDNPFAGGLVNGGTYEGN